jgi:hypothetical protein
MLEVDLNTLASTGTFVVCLGAILNAGGLAWWIRSGTDMKMAQRDAKEAKQKADEASTKSFVLESRVNQLDTIVSEIRTRMAKLDKVDEMVASVKFIQEAVTMSMVPRAELARQWKADEERFKRVEDDLRDLKDAPHVGCS